MTAFQQSIQAPPRSEAETAEADSSAGAGESASAGATAPAAGQEARPGGGGPRRRVGTRIFVWTFPAIAVVVLIAQGAVAWITYATQRESLEQRVDIIADLTAEAIARPVWYLDPTLFKPQVEAIARDDDFRFARVLNDNGAVLFEVGDPAALHASETLSVDRPITLAEQDREVGRLQIAMSKAPMTEALWSVLTLAVLAFVGVVVALSVTTQVTASRLVVRPLNRLLDAMSHVERKDWRYFHWPVPDEFGEVSHTFNRMVDGLRSGDEAKRLLAELQTAQAELVAKNEALDDAHQRIQESITYARRIQSGLLPSDDALGDAVREIAVRWEPLHTVSGDLYWMERSGDRCLIVLADCTGHGVPGSFMTLVVAAALDNLLHERGLQAPAAILAELDTNVRTRLRQDHPDSDSDDGFEAAVLHLNLRTRQLTFAGAGLPLIRIADDGSRQVLRGDRAFLGYRSLPSRTRFTEHSLALDPQAAYYLVSDGVSDQVGGDTGVLYGRRRVVRTLAAHAGKPVGAQVSALMADLDAYRGAEPRRDDLTLIGFRPG